MTKHLCQTLILYLNQINRAAPQYLTHLHQNKLKKATSTTKFHSLVNTFIKSDGKDVKFESWKL